MTDPFEYSSDTEDGMLLHRWHRPCLTPPLDRTPPPSPLPTFSAFTPPTPPLDTTPPSSPLPSFTAFRFPPESPSLQSPQDWHALYLEEKRRRKQEKKMREEAEKQLAEVQQELEKLRQQHQNCNVTLRERNQSERVVEARVSCYSDIISNFKI